MSAQSETSYYALYKRLISHLSTPLYRNGYALTLSSLSTSAIGMVYWILAAHQYSANVVGINSAIISSMMFLAGVSELNLMSALIRFIPTSGRSTKRFVVYTYLISVFLAAIISYVYLKHIPDLSPELHFLETDTKLAAWFIFSTMIWCIFVLQDSVLTGLRRATWVLVENTIFSLVKIGLMLVLAASIPSTGIFVSWSLALVFTVLPTNYFIFRKLIPNHENAKGQENGRIEPRQVIRFAAADYLGAMAWLVSTTMLPVLVTTVAGGTANAYFYLSWTIANTLYLISTSMGSSLVVEAAKDQKKLAAYSLQIFKNMVRIVVPGAGVLIIAAPLVLLVFGKGYSSQGATLLRLLALSAIPNIINAIFVSVSRVQRRTEAVVATLGSISVMVLTLSYILLKIYGIVGVGIAWLVAQTIVAVVVYMTQLRGLWSTAQRDKQGTQRASTNPRWLTLAVQILYKIASRLGLLSLLKDIQGEWSVRQRRAKVETLLPELFKELPPEVYNPAEDQWKVRRVAHTVTNTTVAFLGSRDEPPPVVLKLPGSDKDAESQKKQYETLKSLYSDDRLDGWRHLLPVVVAEGKVGEDIFFAERTLPGVTARQFLKDAQACQQVIDLAANEIGILHRQTAQSTLVDVDLLKFWIHEPLTNLRHLASQGIINPVYMKTIDSMAVQLNSKLAGINVGTSWIHGDYCPSNILVNSTANKITGIVDWDLARPNDLPLLDLIHLLLSVRMELQQRELGHIVRDLLLQGDWTPQELQLIQSAQNDLPGEPIDLQILLILCWLRHINSNLVKTSRFDHHNVWINENVVPVLEALNNWSVVKKKKLGLTYEMKSSEKTLINPAYTLTRPRVTLTKAILSSGTSLLMLAGVILLWIISLPKVDLSKMNDLGLISILPPSFLIALAILAISFILTLKKKNPNEFILLLHVLVLIIILHGTPQILYGTVRYSWAWKHVGIVDYIQRHGSVNPKIHNLNAYHNWPGFFALAAFYNSVAGLQSSIIYAGWAPVFFNILVLSALLMVLKTFTSDRRLIWLSVWFFYLASWVGQDYFSPQAMTYFLYIVVIGIVLTWFKRYKEPLQVYAKQRIQGSWIFRLYDAIVSRYLQENVPDARIDARQRTVMMLSLILILIVIASSHQLTPLMTISALSLLVLFQVVNQRYLPVLMVVVTVGWVLFLAVGFLEGNLYWVVTSFGALFHNFNANLIDLEVASPGQQFIALMDRSLSTLIWVLGFFGFIRRYRAGHWDLPAILLAITPLPMLVLNSYGGEMLFRVYLFSLPFVAFFAASLVYPKQSTRNSLITSLVSALVSFSLLAGFLFAYYGKERMYYFTQNEVAAAEFVYNNAPKGSLLADGTWDWPRQSTNYEFYNYFSIASLPEKEMLRILDDPDVVLSQLMENVAPESVFTISSIPNDQQDSLLVTKGMGNEKYPAAYFIVTRSQLAESQMTGMLKTDWLARIINDLMKSDHFKVVFANSDALVFQKVQVEGK